MKFSARTFSLIQITALSGSLGGRLLAGTNTPFAMSSARIAAFPASIPYCLTHTRPSSGVLAVMVTVSIRSVQAGVSPEAGCSTSLEEEVSFVMSQNTVRRTSTFAASSIATVVPSAVPAVLAANTAKISDQGGRLSLDLQRVTSTIRLHTGDFLSQFAVDLRHRLSGRDGSGRFIRPGKKRYPTGRRG